MAIEEPDFTVLSQEGRFELRAMAPHLVAEITVDATFGNAANRGFRPLVRYISGANRSQEKISMTAPVTQAPGGERIAMTAPVAQSTAEQGEGYVVSFVIPARYTLETVPLPADPRITIREVPSEIVAVLRYRGTWGARRYAAREAELLERLARQGLQPAGPSRWARYNSPFSLPPFRRNEVIIPLAGAGILQAGAAKGAADRC
ncbi:MAG: heme-binding protein [Gammaproteobacteria bacterium]|nr:heme-binding protein [Chromatiales bacterium]MCC5870626.1 heme-binding protein [Gammaproteobacteria bacterium]